MTTIMMPDPATDTRPEVVLGVDTHRDPHVGAILDYLGAELGTAAFATTADGYQAMHAWACSFGPLTRAGIECTGSHGAALSRHLHAAGVAVIEVNQTDRPH